MLIKSCKAISAATVLAFGFASGAAAATITLNAPSAATITIDCPLGCQGYVGSPTASLSPTNADAYSIGNANEGNLAINLNGLIGTSFSVSDVSKTDLSPASEDFDFSVGAGIFFAKYGTWTSFLVSDAAQTVTFKKAGQGPAGLSNYGTIGTSVIPLPAGLPLLLSALGLGGLLRLRQKRKTA